MSRFSKSAAEKAGWVFVHDADEEVLFSGGEQGVTRVKPASVRAEKYVTPTQKVVEEANTMGLLLERINAYEEHLKSRGVETPSGAKPDNSKKDVDERPSADGVLNEPPKAQEYEVEKLYDPTAPPAEKPKPKRKRRAKSKGKAKK